MQKEVIHPNTETNILNAIAKNDLSAFSVLYDKYSNVLFGIIYGITGNVELSEDLLQKTFCAIWQGIGTRDTSKQRFLTWMICIARNFAHEALSPNDPEIRGTINFVNS